MSDEDSLIETEPLKDDFEEQVQLKDEAVNSNQKKRPGKLGLNSNSQVSSKTHRTTRNLRKSNMITSPETQYDGMRSGSVTPEFAMTQSMYEPMSAKQTSTDSKLMNLMAKEKAIQKAQEKREKEKAAKTLELKRRNEERMMRVAERKQQLAMEDRRSRDNVLGLSNAAMTTSIITTHHGSSSINRNRLRHTRKSIADFSKSRPLSSTGKIIGFGSSTPRFVCEPLRMNKNKSPRISQSLPPSTFRMNQSCDNIFEKTAQSPKYDRMMMRSQMIYVKHTNREKRQRKPTSPRATMMQSVTEPKRSRNNEKSEKLTPVKPRDLKTRTKSAGRDTLSNVMTTSFSSSNYKPGLNASRSNLNSTKTPTKEKLPRTGSKPNLNRSTDNLLEKNKTKHTLSNLKKQNQTQKSPQNAATLPTPASIEPKKDITEEEYRDKLRLQRQLAREKKLQQQAESSQQNQNQQNNNQNENDSIINNETPNHHSEKYRNDSVPTNEVSTLSEVSPIKNEETNKTEELNVKSELAVESIYECDSISKDDQVQIEEIKNEAEPSNEHQSEETKAVIKSPRETPKIELTQIDTDQTANSVNTTEITNSTENLGREQRRRKLDSIMSRIRHNPSQAGLQHPSQDRMLSSSTSNINSVGTPGTSVLQTMMEKGKLSGMSRAAAILIKNSQSTEILNSVETNSKKSAEELKNDSFSNLQSENPTNNMTNGYNKESNIETSESSNTVPKDCTNESIEKAGENKPSKTTDNVDSGSGRSFLMSRWQQEYGLSNSIDSEADS